MRKQARIAAKQNGIAEAQSLMIQGQGEDTKASIREATRAASAMEAMAVSMAASAVASQVAAEAARSSARTAKNTLYLSMRARLGVKTLTCSKFGPNQRPVFLITVENYGGKGALIRDYCVVTTVHPLPPIPGYLPEDSWYPLNAPIERQATHELDLEVQPPIAQGEWEQIINGTATYTIYGVIRYDAGFGQTKRFGFCRQYDRELSVRRNGVVFIGTTTLGYNYAE